MIGAFPTLTSDVCPTLSEGIQLESHMLKNGFLERTELALTLGEEYDNKRLREQEDAQEYFGEFKDCVSNVSSNFSYRGPPYGNVRRPFPKPSHTFPSRVFV